MYELPSLSAHSPSVSLRLSSYLFTAEYPALCAYSQSPSELRCLCAVAKQELTGDLDNGRRSHVEHSVVYCSCAVVLSRYSSKQIHGVRIFCCGNKLQDAGAVLKWMHCVPETKDACGWFQGMTRPEAALFQFFHPGDEAAKGQIGRNCPPDLPLSLFSLFALLQCGALLCCANPYSYSCYFYLFVYSTRNLEQFHLMYTNHVSPTTKNILSATYTPTSTLLLMT